MDALTKIAGDSTFQSCMSMRYCADVATVAEGQNLVRGHVLGKLAASNAFAALDPVADTGAEDAAGIAYQAVDATAGTMDAMIIVRGPMIVEDKHLTWPAGITPAQKATAISQLMARRIRVA